jgi:A/G-specific adenine glycosylase
MPWRDHPDPYAVWVSEIMLQQTQVNTVVPYFERWMERFPTIRSLSEAEEEDVLALWEGLGYYSRARNLHRASILVIDQYDGRLPSDLVALRSLPGVGRYTVAAIASIAFGADIATLDGNIRRVFSRLFNISEPVDSPAVQKLLWRLVSENLPPGEAGKYNQALMDLGATICSPRRPACGDCPLAGLCAAHALGLEAERPVHRRRPAVPTRLRSAAVVIQDGKVLLQKRPSRGLLGGLWEFPDAPIELDARVELAPALRAAYGIEVSPLAKMGTVRHAYTHFRVIEQVFACSADSVPPGWTWAEITGLLEYPMGKVARQISRMIE